MSDSLASVTNELVDAQLRAGKAMRLTIPSDSMRPFLAPGDRILVYQAILPELQIGDILLARVGDVLIVHRLIERKDGMLITKGDYHPLADHAFAPSATLGVVGAVERANGRTVSLVSRRARLCNRWISVLSRGQAGLLRGYPGLDFGRRLAHKFLRGLLLYSAGWARLVMG